MKIINSTDWPDYYLRRMVSWCCQQIGLPVRSLRQAQFRSRTTRAYSGHACSSRRIVASVGPAFRFPTQPDTRDGMHNEIIADRVEALVAITAHELEHVRQYVTHISHKLKGRTEAATRAVEVRALRAFRLNRDALLVEWQAAPNQSCRQKQSVQELRAAKAAKMLAAWERKAKLAKTKITKYRRQVRYYEKAAASKAPEKSSGIPKEVD